MASKGGHATIVEMLLRYGADTEVAGRAYGTTSLVAGSSEGYAEGTGAAAQFNRPVGVDVSPVSPTLYVSDYNNHLVRQVRSARSNRSQQTRRASPRLAAA